MARKKQRPQMSEASPLLGADSPFGPPTAPTAEDMMRMPPPPLYSEAIGDLDQMLEKGGADSKDPSNPVVPCDVCQYRIDRSLATNNRVITCPRCQQLTALGPPDEGKKYLRCPECNRLLIVRASVSKAICPNQSCKVTIDVNSGQVLRSTRPTVNGDPPEPVNQTPQYRITCGYCSGNFVQDVLPVNNRIRCPLCRKDSHIGAGAGKRKALIYQGLTLIAIVVCIVLMVTTMGLRHNAGYWYIYLVLMTLAGLLVARGMWCLCMKHSSLEIAAQNV